MDLQGSLIKLPIFWGDQTMQIYGNLDGNPLIKSVLFGWVGNIIISFQKTNGVVLGEVPKIAQCLVYLPTLTP